MGSGKVLSEDMQNEILDYCLRKIAEAKTYYEDYVESKITEMQEVVNGDKKYYSRKMPFLDTKSSYISPDAYSFRESKVAKQLKIYFGGVDVIQVQGTKGNPSEDAAKDRQTLINYQLIEKNNGFTKFKHWFEDAFTNRVGFIKVYPKTDEDWVDQQPIPIVSMDALKLLKKDKTVKITGVQPSSMGGVVVLTQKKQIIESYPKIENIPAYEFLISPRAKSIKSSEFVCHRPKKTIDELRRNIKKTLADGTETGMYWPDAVEEVAKTGDVGSMTIYEETNYQERSALTNEEGPAKEVEVYECYIQWDINDDGLLEPVVATVCGETLLRAEKNQLGRVPIFRASPSEQQHKVWPDISMMDFVCKLAELDTAMFRLWIANLAQNNDPQMGVILEYIEDLDDISNREKLVKLRGTEDIRKVIQQLPIGQIDPTTINFLELKDQKLEKISAVTRINQGVAGEVQGLNKTATGMQLTVGLSNQDDENIARCFAESEDGIGDLFEFMVELNEKYPPPNQEVIELLGHPLTPLPGSTKLRYTVDPTLGTGVKQENLQNYQMMSQDAPLLVQAGLMNMQNVYALKKKQYETMGVKNPDEFLLDPSKQPPPPPPQPKEPNIGENVSIKFELLPEAIQIKMLNNAFPTLQITPDDYVTGALIKSLLPDQIKAHMGGQNGLTGIPGQGGPIGGTASASPNVPGQTPGAGNDGVGNQNPAGSGGNPPV